MDIPDRHFARRDDVIAAFSAAPAMRLDDLRRDIDQVLDPWLLLDAPESD